MLDALLRAFLVIGGVSAACAWTWPGAFPEADPVAVLVRYHTPNFYKAVVAWYYVAPGVAALLAGQFLISTSRIWFARMGVSLGLRSSLPPWPLSPTADGPAIVVGEVHHPVRAIESPAPEWLTIPERGLYTGVAIFGAVGSGKTSACMHPFARQLLGWQATNPERRPAALVLEVKGDFCHDIRRMLAELDREGDYIELSLDGRLTWNPLSATWLDSYSLAYTVASLLNQLFGKGKEPFWQQAYTNLVRWIIELYRVLPPQDGSDTPGWVTLRDVYHCAIDKALFAKKIKEAQTYAADMGDDWITIDAAAMRGDEAQTFALTALGFTPHPARPDRRRARTNAAVLKHVKEHTITHDRERAESASAQEIRLRVEAVNRWYVHDWNTLDNKIRSSIVEGVSVFLSMFDLPSVARVFCPLAPDARQRRRPAGQEPTDTHGTDTTPLAAIALSGDLPPLDQLIERGKVLALNMPAGTNPALARAIGVMLKNAWLQSLLRRPATMQAEPGRYVRPAVFICLQQNACKLLFINRLLVCCTPLSLHCTPHSERDFPAPRTPAVDRSGFNLCRPPPPTPTSRWPERSRRCASTPARIPELSWQPLKRDDAGTNKRFVRCAAFACIPWPSRAGTSDISTDTLGPTLTVSIIPLPAEVAR